MRIVCLKLFEKCLKLFELFEKVVQTYVTENLFTTIFKKVKSFNIDKRYEKNKKL